MSLSISQEAQYNCDPAGARTQDPNIKSVMLYQLSYGIIFGLEILSNFHVNICQIWLPTLLFGRSLP